MKGHTTDEIKARFQVMDELRLTVRPMVAVASEMLYQISESPDVNRGLLLDVHHALETALVHWQNVEDSASEGEKETKAA